MKRLFVLLLTLAIVFSLASCENCGGENTDDINKDNGSGVGSEDGDIKFNEDGSIDFPIIPVS